MRERISWEEVGDTEEGQRWGVKEGAALAGTGGRADVSNLGAR